MTEALGVQDGNRTVSTGLAESLKVHATSSEPFHSPKIGEVGSQSYFRNRFTFMKREGSAKVNKIAEREI